MELPRHQACQPRTLGNHLDSDSNRCLQWRIHRSCSTSNLDNTDLPLTWYLQPSIILAVFMFVGAVFYLYLKARLGPGPFIFATVLGCILIGMWFVSIVNAHSTCRQIFP